MWLFNKTVKKVTGYLDDRNKFHLIKSDAIISNRNRVVEDIIKEKENAISDATRDFERERVESGYYNRLIEEDNEKISYVDRKREAIQDFIKSRHFSKVIEILAIYDLRLEEIRKSIL
jgi:hypothetical protein